MTEEILIFNLFFLTHRLMLSFWYYQTLESEEGWMVKILQSCMVSLEKMMLIDIGCKYFHGSFDVVWKYQTCVALTFNSKLKVIYTCTC